MGRHPQAALEHPNEMKRAEAGFAREIVKPNVVFEMLGHIFEDTPQSRLIEARPGTQLADVDGIARVRASQARRQCQRQRVGKDMAGRAWSAHLRREAQAPTFRMTSS